MDYIPPELPVPFQADIEIPIFKAAESYLPNQNAADDYRCFIVDLPVIHPP
ncbi:MAG: hypothetical protein ACOH5I_08860 [Oligoflexus sp.]